MSLIALKGELDREGGPRLRQAIDASLASDPLIVVLDLRELTFIDSNGIYGMTKIGRACEAKGRRFYLIRPPSHIDRLLTLSGVSDSLDIISDLDELEAGSLTVER
jgi:anti-sigma B factor antagonist